MTYICRLVRKAQLMGEYMPTEMDAEKRAADFRLIAVGKKNTIVWRNGTSELVTDRKLARLQAVHVWAVDF